MSWKRLLVSVLLGFLIMVADGVLLIAANVIWPGHPPHWMTGALFHFDAWPALITRHVFPGSHGGMTFPAIASAAVINLIVLTAVVYGLLSWRSQRKALD